MAWFGSTGRKRPTRWRGLVDLVFVMHCDAETSLKREHATQITLRRGAIMNSGTLAQLRRHYLNAAGRYKHDFKSIMVINKSGGSEMKMVAGVAQRILRRLSKLANEKLHIPPRQTV